MFPTGIALLLWLFVDRGGDGGYSGTQGVWLDDPGVCDPRRKEAESELDEAVLWMRFPIEGRFLFSWSAAARRMAFPWVSEPKVSISVCTGLKANSQSWITCSMAGGGEGNPSSSQ